MTHPLRRLLVPLLLLTFGLLLGACGDDDEQPASESGGVASASANGVDLAFAQAMVPHHESAISMAEVAQRRAESEFVGTLADEIVTSQSEEVGTLNAAISRLEKAGTEPGDLGVEDHEMGMDADMAMLESADPFDKAFIDMMVPHHEGAVTMAEAELEGGKDPELRRLAEAIIEAQEREIEEMNDHRTEVHGGPVESGGHGEM
jgi:uncharacterized protein (DUF305 family)